MGLPLGLSRRRDIDWWCYEQAVLLTAEKLRSQVVSGLLMPGCQGPSEI